MFRWEKGLPAALYKKRAAVIKCLDKSILAEGENTDLLEQLSADNLALTETTDIS